MAADGQKQSMSRRLKTKIGMTLVDAIFHRSWTLVTGILALYMLSGCLPIRSKYFYPEASGLTATGAFCRGSVGPPESLSKKQDLNSYAISARREHGDDGYVEIMIIIKPKVENAWTVIFDEMAVYGKQSDDVIPIVEISSDYRPYAGDPPANTGTTQLFKLRVQLGARTEFHVVVPTIENPNAPVVRRVVSFTEKSGVFVYPMNC